MTRASKKKPRRQGARPPVDFATPFRPGLPQKDLPPQEAPSPSDKSDALRMIGAVSHEMRNPLNGIIGMAHLLRETKLDAAQRNYLDGITASGDLLLTLVNDLLDLTAVKNGAFTPHYAPAPIDALINGCIELAAPRAHAKGLAVGSVVDPTLVGDGPDRSREPLVTIDAQRVGQILTNLLSNAVKFTSEGGVRVEVRLDSQTSSGGKDHMLMIDVVDSGHGIAAAEQALVFQPFGRTTLAQQTANEGTGLGLPLSRGLAQAMGGSLDLVSSAPGEGTHMRLTLPVVLDTMDFHGQPQPLAGHSVLLVLSPGLSASPEGTALQSTLHELGAHAEIHGSVEALGDTVGTFDQVIIDAGFDHAVLWARLHLPTIGIRPVLLVKPDERKTLPRYQQAGFYGYLVRPVRQTSLVAMMTHRFSYSDDNGFLPDPADAETPEIPGEPLRLLIAEDDPVNARLATAALERAGHTVSTVGDGGRAIALATSNVVPSFDVVLLDLSMPAIGGLEAAQRIRKGGFKGRLLAYSGNTDPALNDQLVAAGFDDFARKPLHLDALLAFVTGQPSIST